MAVLDAWALLAWLLGEQPAAAAVEAAIDDDATTTWVNLGEVAYIVERRYGAETAQALIGEVGARLRSIAVADRQLSLAAARIKAAGGLSFADAFAAAAAQEAGATLFTGDPELLVADRSWAVRDLRADVS